jgi:signal peptide peptidase SppA
MFDLQIDLPISQHRLDEYYGLWCYEPSRFRLFSEMISRADISQHQKSQVSSTLKYVSQSDGKSVALVLLAGSLMKQQSSMGGTSTIQARRDLRSAAMDPKVTGIILAIDSPGGTVAGTYDLAADVWEARKRKPVFAQIEDLGASAAYWVASQCTEIYANAPTAWVGSVGTIYAVYDESAKAEREGVKPVILTTGDMKGFAHPGTQITSEQIAFFQSLINEGQTYFDAAIARGRGTSVAKNSRVKSGGVFTAAEAVDLGLIDGIQSIEKTLSLFERDK